MPRRSLILLLVGLLTIQYATTFNNERCQKTIVKRDHCINGKRNLKITTYLRENGTCRPFPATTNVYCLSHEQKSCKCSVAGALHYRTFDGQVIHFYGDCKYTLSEYRNVKDHCSFNIMVENEYRSSNQYVPHTKSVSVQMYGDTYELGLAKTLKVNEIAHSVPFEKADKIRIFRSHHVLQFVAPQCSVRISFDGESSVYVEVGKNYAKKMIGICGDCNGVHDDFKTKAGKDVSKQKHKFSLIANSYKVPTFGRLCKTAVHISYENICGHKFTKQAKKLNFCGGLFPKSNPFEECEKRGHIDLRNFLEDCVIEMCVNKNKPTQFETIRCKILTGVAEVCADHGFAGIKWRSKFNCTLACGPNKHFSKKASPCPRTCENHFFGTKAPCYDLPEREGCECNKGYILDGSLCVKPMHCKCINLCVDRKGAVECQKWKSRGECKNFPEQMNILCSRTCGFCKGKDFSCEDELSSKKCLEFLKNGLCIHEFYKLICGLTCNLEKCSCGEEKSVTVCNKLKRVETTTHYSYARDLKGRCAKIITKTYNPCNCDFSDLARGQCNFCTGKREITRVYGQIVKNKCESKVEKHFEACEKCPPKAEKDVKCISDRLLQTTVHFNRLDGCYYCVGDKNETLTEIKCKDDKKEEVINCVRHTTLTIRKPINCKCVEEIIHQAETVCCSPPVIMEPFCQDRQIIFRKKIFKLIKGACIQENIDKTQTPNCAATYVKKAACEPLKYGIFYCQAEDERVIQEVNNQCKCVTRIEKLRRTCCCKKPSSQVFCDRERGIITTIHVQYNLTEKAGHFECVQIKSETFKILNYDPREMITLGVCQLNCQRIDKITKKVRDGCEIKTTFRNEMKICCGIPNKWTETVCELDYTVTREYQRIVRDNKVFDFLINEKRSHISCPREKVTETDCVAGHKTVTTQSFINIKCKCVEFKTSAVIKCWCPYKIFKVDTEPCNKETCQNNVITYFQDELCLYGQKICPNICCCPPPVVIDKYCDTLTGYWKTETKKYYLDEANSVCKSETRVRTVVPLCEKPQKVEEKCEAERQNYAKVVTTVYTLSEASCECTASSTYTWKWCMPTCPPQQINKICRDNYFHLETVSYEFNCDETDCIATKTEQDVEVCCPLIKEPQTTIIISPCKYKVITRYYDIENCKCELRETSNEYFSCCSGPLIKSNCENENTLVTMTTSYSVSDCRKVCVSSTIRNTNVIICDAYTKTWKTKVENREYYIVTEHYQVEDCVCKLVSSEKDKRISECPPPFKKTTCAGQHFLATTTTYKLVDDKKCISSEVTNTIVLKCPSPEQVIFPCNPITRLKSVKRIYYDIVNCKCIRREILNSNICSCVRKQDDIRRPNICRPNKTRVVEVYRYRLGNDRCDWFLIKSFEEDCKCQIDESTTSCVKNSIFRIKTTKYDLKLISEEYPRYKCVGSTSEINKPIECYKDYFRISECKNFMKQKMQCVFEKINCVCNNVCRVSEEMACGCKKRDHSKEECIGNVKYLVHYKYKACKTKCKASQTKIRIRETSPKSFTECSQPTIHENHGFYKLCKTTNFIYHECRYIPEIIEKKIIVSCDNSFKTDLCISNRKILRITNYVIKDNHCVTSIFDYFMAINCPKYSIVPVERGDIAEYRLTYFFIENCQCVKRTLTRHIHKCRNGMVSKTCIDNRWVYSQVVNEQIISKMKLFPEVNDPMRARHCHKSKHHWLEEITCPPNYHIIRKCNLATKLRKKEVHYQIVEKCRCVKKVNKSYKRCKLCPHEVIIRSHCGPRQYNGLRYIDVTTTTWDVKEDNKCYSHTTKTKEICECKQNEKSTKCINGEKVFKRVTFELHSKPQCKRSVQSTSERISCYNHGRMNQWITVKVDLCQHPNQFTLTYLERQVFNSKDCTCKLVKKVLKTNICCKPCKYTTVCIDDNKIIKTKVCQRDDNLKCVEDKTINMEIKSCPSPIEKVIGDCRGNAIMYNVMTFKSVKCRCIGTTSKRMEEKKKGFKKCVNSEWKHTEFDYDLIGFKCVGRPPRIWFEPVYCCAEITHLDKRINDCTFTRSYYKKTNTNCNCVDKLVRSETLNYKCCQKNLVSKRCKHDRTWEITTTTYKLSEFRCYPVDSVANIPVDCSHIKLRVEVHTDSCNFKIEHYNIVYSKCQCSSKLISVERNLKSCCNDLKPQTRHSCDPRRGVEVTIFTTFQHQRFECKKIDRTIEIVVDCDRRPCEHEKTNCVKHTQTITRFGYRRNQCVCVRQKIKEHNVCCGPDKDSIWSQVNKCNAHKQYYELVQTFALKLNAKSKQCEPTVIGETYKICECPKSFVREKCDNDVSKTTTTTSFVINRAKNVCEKRENSIVTFLKECPTKRTLIVGEPECGSKPGWCKVKYQTIYPKNCECKFSEQVIEEICDCCLAFPCHGARDYCKDNNVIVHESKEPRCAKTTMDWVITNTFTRVLNCERTEIELGNCFSIADPFAISARYRVTVRYSVENCNCYRHEIKSELIHCACQVSYQTEQCRETKKIITTFNYPLINDHCKEQSSTVEIPIPCPKEPKITKSKCSNNQYVITTETFFYDNCQCKSTLVHRTCDCQCPLDTTTTKCSGDYFFKKVITKYHKEHCRCEKKETVTLVDPACPQFQPQTIGDCLLVNECGYRKITTRKIKLLRDVCKCQIEESTTKQVCDFKRPDVPREYCEDNHIVNEIWRWRINIRENICDKYKLSSKSSITVCPGDLVTSEFNQKTELVTETTVKYHAKNCRCVEHKKTVKIPCHRKPVLVKNGTCSNQPKCLRNDLYEHYEFKDKKCIKVTEEIKDICCCPPKRNVTFCSGNSMVFKHKEYRLENGICVKYKRQNSVPVICSKTYVKKVPEVCDNTGRQRIIVYREFARKCKCVNEVLSDEYCQCRCGKDEIRKSCENVKGIERTTVRKYILVNCKCEVKEETTTLGKNCEASYEIVGPCLKQSHLPYWLKTHTSVQISLDSDCQCRTANTTIQKICDCDPDKQNSTSCDEANHKVVTIERQTVFKDGHCVQVSKKVITPVICDKEWKLVDETCCQPNGVYGIKYLFYKKMVNDKCSCKEITKEKPCDCACSGPSTGQECKNELVHHYSYKYQLIRCKCHRSIVGEKTEKVECGKRDPDIGQCKIENGFCVRYDVYHDTFTVNCRCYEGSRIVRSSCRDCHKPCETVKLCNKVSNTITTKTICYEILQDGFMKASVTENIRPVLCDTRHVCNVVSPCNRITGTETVKCVESYVEDCQIKSKNDSYQRICQCKTDSTSIGTCNKKTCIREITTTHYSLVNLNSDKRECVDKKTISTEICCCLPNPPDDTKCISNSLIKTTTTLNYDEKNKKCDSNIQTFNVTPNCGPAFEKGPAFCERSTCRLSEKTKIRTLKNCQCNVKEEEHVSKCCCPEDYTNNTCSGDKIVVSNYRFSLQNGKCSSIVTQSERVLDCPASTTQSFECNPKTCLRIIRTTNINVSNCNCISYSTDVTERCCCPEKTSSTSCILADGIIRTINKWFYFDAKNHKCVEHMLKDDKMIECLKTPKTENKICELHYNNGIYQSTVTYSEKLEGCSCKSQYVTRYSLCHCDPDETITSCENNQILTKTITYEKRTSNDGLYDYQCVRKETSRSSTITCPDPSTKTKSCDKGVKTMTNTTYELKNCECVPTSVDFTDTGCQTKYCYEMPNITQCKNIPDPSNCDGLTMADCPITCGYCVKCQPKDLNCEFEDFGNGDTSWARVKTT